MKNSVKLYTSVSVLIFLSLTFKLLGENFSTIKTLKYSRTEYVLENLPCRELSSQERAENIRKKDYAQFIPGAFILSKRNNKGNDIIWICSIPSDFGAPGTKRIVDFIIIGEKIYITVLKSQYPKAYIEVYQVDINKKVGDYPEKIGNDTLKNFSQENKPIAKLSKTFNLNAPEIIQPINDLKMESNTGVITISCFDARGKKQWELVYDTKDKTFKEK